MPNIHLAQINIGRMKAPLEDPVMAGFMARLDEINAPADRRTGSCGVSRAASGTTLIRAVRRRTRDRQHVGVGDDRAAQYHPC